MIASYFSLFTKEVIAFHNLAIIKFRVASYSISLLAYPKYEARYNNLLFVQKTNNFFDYTIKQFKKILNCSSAYDNVCSLELSTKGHKNECIKERKLFRELSKGCTSSHKLNRLLNKQLAEAMIYGGLDWHLYSSNQIKFLYTNLYLDKSNKLCLMSSCFLVLNKSIRHLSEFLNKAKANLKSLKCTVCRYINKIIYISSIDCVIAENYSRYLFKPSKQCIRDLVSNIKKKLYHKNKYGYWRANTYLSSLQAALSIKKAISLWYTYYSSMLSKQEAIKIGQIIDYVFYKWQVK